MSKEDSDRVSPDEIGPPGVEADYVNPADKSPRWLLSAHAWTLRLGAALGFGLGNMSGAAAPPSPTKTIWLDSTLGKWRGEGKFSADVWIPPGGGGGDEDGGGKRPAVINFHGGGFILGQGTDDARWAGAAMAGLGAVVFSVNYRLAPSYPFPTAVEDCVDAIVQICAPAVAEQHGVDPRRVVVSGFSAGGTLAASSWAVLQDPARWGYELSPAAVPRIAGLVLYYPLLDWTLDRPQKRNACERPDLTLPSSLTDLIDASYMHPALPRRERDDIRLSPGLMPDDMIDRLPPVHLCLCEYDMLLAEGKLFAERLERRGKAVSVRVVEGAKHAWDKPLPLAPKQSVAVEYQKAIEAIKGWLEKAS
ncbi:Alpha/Beta hydrolase protein [Biscogniauxia sp. FL1348]|nr:Alpha/Beta hydrolase protein [Biscogniauxia sp. FL1348]